MGRDVLEAFIIIWRNLFSHGEENVKKGCHSKPTLDYSERGMLIRYESRDCSLKGPDVSGDIPLLESDPQRDDGD